MRNPITALMRLFYAASAPAEVPTWYSQTDEEPRPRALSIDECLRLQPGFSILPPADQQRVRDWAMDGSYDLTPEPLARIGEAAAVAFSRSAETHKAAQRRREIARYFGWRWYYADKMVSAEAQWR